MSIIYVIWSGLVLSRLVSSPGQSPLLNLALPSSYPPYRLTQTANNVFRQTCAGSLRFKKQTGRALPHRG